MASVTGSVIRVDEQELRGHLTFLCWGKPRPRSPRQVSKARFTRFPAPIPCAEKRGLNRSLFGMCHVYACGMI
jgi:hypothetical protein